MDAKSILLAVADPQALVDIVQALGNEWQATSVSKEADALAQLEQRSFDALLVDFNLGSPDASQLMNQALERRPETTRFLLAYEADLALVAAMVTGPHELLPKPVEPASLKSRIESGVAREDSNSNPSGGAPETSASASPAVPAVYSEVLKALESPGITKRQVGEMIAGDATLMSEVLKLTNSAHLGLPHNITDPVEAVESLGLETVKALVMALRFLAEHSHLKSSYLSLEKLWQHSTRVAQTARDLVLFETKDRALAAEALVAGLLHDLGKVVLATNFDDLYGRVYSLAHKQPVALWDIEREMFGASHGEIGACLVGMWNMPRSVVEAAAFHHEPPLGEHQQLTPLAAVHIANVLEHEIRPSDEFRLAPVINPAFLNEIGLLQRLPVWRAAFANGRDASSRPATEPAETSRPQTLAPAFSSAPPPSTANQLPPPAAATRTATAGHLGSDDGLPVAPVLPRTRWVYAGAAVVVFGLLALWLETLPDDPVRARAPAPTAATAPAVVPPAPAAVPEAALAMAAAEEATAATAQSSVTASEPEISLTEPEPTPALPVSQATPTNAAPPSSALKEQTPPDFRLNGIIYTVHRPSAIVNGRTVYVGDWVNGATVISIGPDTVTLEFNGQRKTCLLR
jgi:HD-like signal output (HDOD) protein/CheY-like chemotaxis protein